MYLMGAWMVCVPVAGLVAAFIFSLTVTDTQGVLVRWQRVPRLLSGTREGASR